MTDAPKDRSGDQSRRFIPTNKEMYAQGTPFGPAVGPAQRRRNRKEGKKFEKMMNEEAARGDENWPPRY